MYNKHFVRKSLSTQTLEFDKIKMIEDKILYEKSVTSCSCKLANLVSVCMTFTQFPI
jgi:hypothetical protein